VKQLFPALEEGNSEKVQIIADDGDSGIPHTEMESVVIVKSPEPLEVGKFMFSCTKSKAPQKWWSSLEKSAGVSRECMHETVEYPDIVTVIDCFAEHDEACRSWVLSSNSG
jgi:hypothetical protein